MGKKNDGTNVVNKIQNEFTAYFATAVKNYKISYIQRKLKYKQYEMPLELQQFDMLETNIDLLAGLHIKHQIEDSFLLNSLENSRERDVQILYMRAVEGRTFQEIANSLGINTSLASTTYYGLLKKIRGALDKE